MLPRTLLKFECTLIRDGVLGGGARNAPGFAERALAGSSSGWLSMLVFETAVSDLARPAVPIC
jgi:hypothetical protein